MSDATLNPADFINPAIAVDELEQTPTTQPAEQYLENADNEAPFPSFESNNQDPSNGVLKKLVAGGVVGTLALGGAYFLGKGDSTPNSSEPIDLGSRVQSGQSGTVDTETGEFTPDKIIADTPEVVEAPVNTGGNVLRPAFAITDSTLNTDESRLLGELSEFGYPTELAEITSDMSDEAMYFAILNNFAVASNMESESAISTFHGLTIDEVLGRSDTSYWNDQLHEDAAFVGFFDTQFTGIQENNDGTITLSGNSSRGSVRRGYYVDRPDRKLSGVALIETMSNDNIPADSFGESTYEFTVNVSTGEVIEFTKSWGQ